MHNLAILKALLCIFSASVLTAGVELTFELPDNAKQCFHEDIEQGVKSTVEFQVCIYCSKYLPDMLKFIVYLEISLRAIF